MTPTQKGGPAAAVAAATAPAHPGPALPDAADPFIRTVEWDMLNKSKYFPLSMLSQFTVRSMLYPLSLVRTRLQVQLTHAAVYRGTWDCFCKIVRHEGVRGLYQGFWVSSLQVFSGVAYVTTYEGVRHLLDQSGVRHSALKGFAGGSAASLVSQTIIVPVDIVSQHLMLIGQKVGPAKAVVATAGTNALNIPTEGRSKAQIVRDLVQTLYKRDGLRGFYRGYTTSLSTYVPSSAFWWGFYHLFQDTYGAVLPGFVPHTVLQCLAAMSSGCASCVLTNPLDLVRTRVQVHRRPIPETIRRLWAVERFRIFSIGLTARITSSVIYSVALVLGYESVKRWSVLDEYKDRVKW